MTPRIRAALPKDLPAIEALYPAAFPTEDLLPLVRALIAPGLPTRPLVAEAAGLVIGHVVFTDCTVGEAGEPVALLGPLAVAPAWQGQGVGRALVEAGMSTLRAAGMRHLLVLGDPAYYGRFGFTPAATILPPYPVPEAWRDGWQYLPLTEATAAPMGTLKVPLPWQHPGLWAP
jgi:putative acetyltransferase